MSVLISRYKGPAEIKGIHSLVPTDRLFIDTNRYKLPTERECTLPAY